MTKLKTQPCSTCGGLGTLPAEGVGQVLREEREKAGITGVAMSEHMGISTTFLYDLEKGGRRWTNELLAAYQGGLEALKTNGK